MNLFRGGKTNEPPVHYAAARTVALKRAELLKTKTRRSAPDGTWSERIGTGGDSRDIGRKARKQVTDNIRNSAEERGGEVFNRAHAADPNNDRGRFDRADFSTRPLRTHIANQMRTDLNAIERPTGPRVPILRPPANKVIKKGPTILRPPIGFKPR
jgi:hypothetical protein